MGQKHPLQTINFTNPHSACVVEASAGTGKTWTIERLFIKALLEFRFDSNLPISIENILVVTFTNDATDELKQRIQEQIYLAINQIIILHNHPEFMINQDLFGEYLVSRKAYYTEDITLLTRAYQSFDMAAIYTIHGFCNKILHDYQFECQINTDFDLVNSRIDIIEQIVYDFMRSEILNKFKQNVEIVVNNLELLFTSNNFNLTLEQRIAAKLPKDLFKIEKGLYKLKYKLNARARLDMLLQPEIENLVQCKAEFLAYLIKYVNREYPVRLAKTTSLSYDELIQRVADALCNSQELANKIFNLFPVAFIDEFQDTDLLQWQIFSLIYQLNSNNKRGNVVVVGDPKQAIYRFRGADVDTYLEAKNQIENKLDLDINFRSHTNIINFINQLFNLTNQKSGVDNSFFGSGIDYTNVSTQSSSKIVLPNSKEIEERLNQSGVESKFYDAQVHLVAVKGSTKPERIQKMLQNLTFEILALLKVQPELTGKIAILVTRNKEGSEVVKYLRKYGLKASELKLGNIFATASAKNLYLFLVAVFDLTNRQNFIKAISTSLFNLPLINLANEVNLPNPVLQKLQEDFFSYQQIWNSSGIISLIYALLNNLFSTSNNKYILNHRELANIWQLAELLNRSKSSNQTELLFWFKRKITNAENNLVEDIDGSSEEVVRLDNDDEQIIVTTQHKAKGLEYEILFCPFFKNNVSLDGTYDFNYRRPFFSNYRYQNTAYSEMVLDKERGEYIVNKDNTEAQRLNYVALTRARSRIYIYLKQHTYTRTGSYNSSERPDKLVELFGYVKNNPKDRTHQLFNYSDFFCDEPGSAIKTPDLFPGVIVYNRDQLTKVDLDKLKFKNIQNQERITNLEQVASSFHCSYSFYRQSYSALTKKDYDNLLHYTDNDDTENPQVLPSYLYSILNDSGLKGAIFGTLFHSLCENYPFSDVTLLTLLKQYNVNITNNDYVVQLTKILDEAFTYPVLDNIGIRHFSQSMHELEFNLQIKSKINIVSQISPLLSHYFGEIHPFTIASKSLSQIDPGFLVGFIDLVFEHDGKYWVLDYKTNALQDYTSSIDIKQIDNPLIQSMAEHHYYLQYLLYLVALKRYLQQRLKIDDATNLIGGAVYYYVRGIYSTSSKLNQGVVVDRNCQSLIHDLDMLFR